MRGMLPAPLEESASTARPLKARNRIAVGFAAAILATAVVSCGGGERQDEDEPEGEFPVQVTSADFPPEQRLAQNTNLNLGVRNTGDEEIPDLAITIFTTSDAQEETGEESGTTTDGGETDTEGTATAGQQYPEAQGAFSVRSEQEDLAIPFRPVWILEEGYPRLGGETVAAGAESAQTNTFSFGPLAPGETREMVWNVTPVQAGTFTVHYRVAAGLQGKATAVTADGSVPEGEFVVLISSEPPQTRVDESGKVVPIRPGDIIGQAGSQEQKSELDGQ